MFAIAAISKNRVIGKDSKIPWYLPADLKKFKAITQNNLVIMGRKTFESLGNKPLKNRENFVLSRNLAPIKNITIFNSFQQLLQELQSTKIKNKKKFIIGGGEIYTLFLPYIQKIYLSVIQSEFKGDVFFPKFEEDFELENSEKREDSNLPFEFQTWTRVSKSNI